MNDLVNNDDKAALLYNSQGKGKTISCNIGEEEITSKKTEKLLGLHIASDFNWKIHCEKLSVQLKLTTLHVLLYASASAIEKQSTAEVQASRQAGTAV